MSLWFVLRVEDRIIGTLEVQRLKHRDLTDPATMDTVNPYVVIFNGDECAKLEHRYGDGAWELLRKSLERLKEIGKISPAEMITRISAGGD